MKAEFLIEKLKPYGVGAQIITENVPVAEVGFCWSEKQSIEFDFSEHDKKVTEEKDAQIRELKRQIEDLEAIISDGKKPDISVSENGVSVGCECGGYHLAKERIAELEKEIERLNRVVESKRETHILLRQRCKGEAVEFFDRNMFGSLIISSPPLEDSKRISELEDRHQSDCIRINQLLTTIDVLTERHQKLREVHGL